MDDDKPVRVDRDDLPDQDKHIRRLLKYETPLVDYDRFLWFSLMQPYGQNQYDGYAFSE